MKLKTKVKAERDWSVFRIGIVKDAIRFAIKEYGLDVSKAKLVLKLVEDTGPAGDGGAMVQHVKKGEVTKFVVWIHAGSSMKNMLEYVFHEMTHVKQALFDDWQLSDDTDTARWKGEIVEFTGEGNSYWNAPWEVEARKMGRVLRKKYIKTT